MSGRVRPVLPHQSLGDIADAHFRVVADCTYDWESWHSPDGTLIWVNPAVVRLTGYSIDECRSMAEYPLPIVLPADRSKLVQIFHSAQKGSCGNDVEFSIVHRDGDNRSMAISWQPMYDGGGRHLGFRTSIRDVTERKRLRDQLRLHAEHLEQLVQERTARIQHLERHRQQMEKLAALGQLAAGVAHEINNPLAGMRNAFELIKTGLSPQHEHYQLLVLVDHEIERIASIVHQMYQLYRRYPQPPAPFDLPQAVRDVLCLLDRVAKKKHVSLTFLPAEVPALTLPEGEVKQVLYNLLCNAIEASPINSAVCVELRATDQEVLVSVVDRGHGISPEVLPLIFDPFFSTGDEHVHAGMGLGLSISKNIVEALGGRIDVHTQPGSGSTFVAVFPVSGLQLSLEKQGDHATARKDPDRR